MALTLLFAIFLAGLTGCATTGQSTSQRFVFTYLIVDDPSALPKDALARVIKAHRSNIDKLVDQEKILIAGPLFEPLIAEGYNGIFLFNVDNAQEATAFFMTDPAVQARVFKPEMFFFDSAQAVTEIPRLEREDKAIRLADPDIPDDWTGRAYILAIASPNASFTNNQSVLIDAILTPIDDTNTSRVRMLFLDFENVDEASANFECSDITQWSFYGLYATNNLARLDDAMLSE